MLHHIQRSTLDRLATAQTLRYGELKPQSLDGNVFGYHLKALLRDKYIIRLGTGDYSLTQKGKDYIVHRYENPLLQAHSIFLIALRRGDEWLMRERLVQPLIGMTGFIHGEPLAGETAVETAMQRLTEKTGIVAELRVHSSGLIRIADGDNMESFSHALVLIGETDAELQITEDTTGRNFWLPTSALRGGSVLPSSADIADRIITGDTSPFDLSYTLPE
jgi:hypothetical protein